MQKWLTTQLFPLYITLLPGFFIRKMLGTQYGPSGTWFSLILGTWIFNSWHPKWVPIRVPKTPQKNLLLQLCNSVFPVHYYSSVKYRNIKTGVMSVWMDSCCGINKETNLTLWCFRLKQKPSCPYCNAPQHRMDQLVFLRLEATSTQSFMLQQQAMTKITWQDHSYHLFELHTFQCYFEHTSRSWCIARATLCPTSSLNSVNHHKAFPDCGIALLKRGWVA